MQGLAADPTGEGRRAAAAASPVGPITVIVAAPGGGPDLQQLLDHLAAQRGVPTPHVLVADDVSSPSAEAARRHPLVDRVALGTHRAPGALVGRALWSVRNGVVAVVEPTARPDPDWLRRAVGALPPGGAIWAVADGGVAVLVEVDELQARLRPFGQASVPPGSRAADLRRWLEDAGVPFAVAPTAGDGGGDAPALARGTDGAPTATTGYDGLVSVVVCTSRRPDPLHRCLVSLQRLADDDHEVLVVDNEVTPRYDRTEIEALGARYVHEPRPGLDHARNRGWQEARGEVIAYVDDDCEVDRDWLTGLRRGLTDDAVALVTGRVVPASLRLPSERWFEAWFGFDRGMLPDRFTADDPRPWAGLYPSGLGTGANMAFRSTALAAIGGFDPLLDVGSGIGGGGDIDAFARLLDTGAVAHYRPDALVVHHHRTATPALRRQFFGYGQALGALSAKYALERDGHRREAVHFYRERLRDHGRRLRPGRRRISALPLWLTAVEAAGQLHGPLVYLWLRWRRPWRPGPRP